MAILYGTQSNGETLPVLVDQFGNLLAKGIEGNQGPPGPEGPEGPEGPPGPIDIQYLEFAPEYVFDGDGEAVIEYRKQKGQAYVLGDLVIVTGYIATKDVLITNPRGSAFIKVPDYVGIASQETYKGIGHFKWFKDDVATAGTAYSQSIPYLQVQVFDSSASGGTRWLATTDFREGSSNSDRNAIGFNIIGRYLSPDEIARQAEARAAIIARLSEVTSTTDID